MQTTFAVVLTAITTVAVVRVWEPITKDMSDYGYHLQKNTLMSELNSSFGRSIKEYSNEIDIINLMNFKQEINKNYSAIQVNLNACIENFKTKMRNMTIAMSEFYTSCIEHSYKFDIDVDALKQKIIRNYSTLQVSLNECSEKNDKCENETRNIRSEFQKIANDVSKDELWYSIILLGVGEVVVTIVLACVVRKLNALKTVSSNGVLSQESIARGRENLRKSLTIIIFNETRKTIYRDLMEDISSGMETEFRSVLRKEDAFQINSMVSVLFVERNDRHIILESEHEIGDLKVSCVRYIQQKGGHVIVVYCGHKESDSLGDRLCSPSLMSADRHRELKTLKDEKCFLSINKTFSQTQKNHLKAKIKEYIDSR